MRIFLSYPKAGRTWVRFMVDSYLCRLHELAVGNVFEAEEHPRQPVRIVWTHLTAAMLLKRHWWEMGPIQLGQEANAERKRARSPRFTGPRGCERLA